MKAQETEMNRDFWTFVKACMGIILVGAVVIFLNQPATGINIVLTGTLMIILAVLLGKEHHFQDERSRRIREKAGYNAYVATLITMFLLMAFGKTLLLIESANYISIITLIFFAGLSCFLIFRRHYGRKGDAL